MRMVEQGEGVLSIHIKVKVDCKKTFMKCDRLQMEGELENVWWIPLTWSMTLTKK